MERDNNNKGNQDMNKTNTIKQGVNGSGENIWLVFTTWTAESGSSRLAIERFATLGEAQSWAKWA